MVKTEKEKLIEKKEKDFSKLILDGAKKIIQQNANYIGKDIAKEAIKKINNQNTKEEVDNDEEQEVKTRRTTKKSN